MIPTCPGGFSEVTFAHVRFHSESDVSSTDSFGFSKMKILEFFW